MIYHIFGGDTETIVGLAKKSVYTTDDLKKAIEHFNIINQNHKFLHSYLVCDFEIANHKLFSFAQINDGDERLPFLIIAEYHEDEDAENPLLTCRVDTIIVKSDGFNHEFTNNIKAVMQFTNNIINHKATEMRIIYNYINDKNIKCTNNALIATSDEIIDSIEKNLYIKKFVIDKLSWEQASTRKSIDFNTLTI